MPHVVYLHSALTQRRIKPENDDEKRELMRFQRVDVMIAMGLAGIINLTMLVVAASCSTTRARRTSTRSRVPTPGSTTLLGGGAALAFAVALLASGLSSSSVGTYAGQVVMQGFIDFRIKLFLRRAITMSPALVVLALGLDATSRSSTSQVVLSVRHSVRARADDPAHAPRRPHGSLVNRPVTTAVAGVVAALIIGLNAFLLYETFF